MIYICLSEVNDILETHSHISRLFISRFHYHVDIDFYGVFFLCFINV